MITLDKDEHIVIEIRKHWFVFAAESSTLLILALVPLIIPALVNSFNINIIVNGGHIVALFIFLYSLWLFVLWILAFIFWTDYYLDIWLVTNKKILDVEQDGLFNREVSILHLDKVQDITSEVNGVFATFINYGNIHVQTAGQQREFIIRNAPDAHETRRKINDALLKYNENIVHKVGE
jgi:uncharacterized membrane protein YdbT with pleckstrin-like domain